MKRYNNMDGKYMVKIDIKNAYNSLSFDVIES